MDEEKMARALQQAIDHRLSGLTEDPFLARKIIDNRKGSGLPMKKRVSMAFIVAVAMLLLLAGTAAAARLGVLRLFTFDGRTNVNAAAGVQTLSSRYDGDYVRFTVNEAIYDKAGESYSLGFTIENLTGSDRLYVYCDGIFFDGERSDTRSELFGSEYILPPGVSEGTVTGELPEHADGVCEVRYTILRGLYPFVEANSVGMSAEEYMERIRKIRKNGGIPIDVDGWIYTDDSEWAGKTYIEMLLETGQFEIADRFTLRVDMSEKLLDGTKKTYAGPKEFVFDGYALEVVEAYTTPTAACIEVAYITDEAPETDGDWSLSFTTPDGSQWAGSGDGLWDEPVRMEDGRYRSVYRFEALHLFVQPEALQMALVTWDDSKGRTVHEEDAVTLDFR